MKHMDYPLIGRLLSHKLRDRSTYNLALVVGTLINCYGQLLVPWFRSDANPFPLLVAEFDARPLLTLFSVFLGYAFPFCVGTYSAFTTQDKNRRIASIADFPERKLDPVFRADKNGALVELGANTKTFFETHHIDDAQGILGAELWADIAAKDGPGDGITVHFAENNTNYLVSHVPTEDNLINIYLSRIPG